MRQRNPFRHLGAALGFMLVGAVAGCGGSSMDGGSMPVGPTQPPSSPGGPSTTAPPAVAQAQQANTPVDPAIVTADNTFGVNLFQNLYSGAPGNVAIAPISVAMALQIVYNGAGGATQQGMAQTLQLGPMSTADLNNDNAALQGSLMNPDPQVNLTIANSLWMHLDTTQVAASFTQMDQMYYGATVGDLAGAPDNVNSWVSTETDGLITSILPPANYATVVAVIANVIYFKGQWTTGFDSSQTAPAPFTLMDGTQVSVPMMHQSANYGYLQGANFQAVRIPYGAGRFSMLAVMPNAGTSLDSFVAALTPDMLNTWEGQLQTEMGNLSMPKFTATFGASLVQPLTTLGMQAAFCSDPQASFPGIGLVCIQDVEHKTVVEVDESGTVAAGATTVTLGPTAVEAPMFTLSLDHPFVYAIRDDKTGELLFIGTMTNPS
ncbi:MAG TPA: serpin family protein [Steroidobacteraceae bacterium]|jgi:serine protease inhibitor|nr:serpin family protein [Steroidobacteraceae bacterium]